MRRTHLENRRLIVERINEFYQIHSSANDEIWWRELVFCIFTANASARMGLRSVEAVKDLILHADAEELAAKLRGVHRFPNARAGYIATTREFLQTDCELKLRDKLHGFTDAIARRDWLAQTKQIKGLGYKEASHFLRNIGFRGYAILDKHILNCLREVGVIDDNKPKSKIVCAVSPATWRLILTNSIWCCGQSRPAKFLNNQNFFNEPQSHGDTEEIKEKASVTLWFIEKVLRILDFRF